MPNLNTTMVHPAPVYQENVGTWLDNEPERKYRVGAMLRFVNYSSAEDIKGAFKRGDLLRVVKQNGCGMGIDVVRLSDGRIDMVWPEEVTYCRHQYELKWSPDTVWVNASDACLGRFDRRTNRMDVHRPPTEFGDWLGGRKEIRHLGQCIEGGCGLGDYSKFAEMMFKHHNIELPKELP